ncbi:MAG: hypothetical protein ACRENA_09095 [Vulcanimicrobiaceae bacterium]
MNDEDAGNEPAGTCRYCGSEIEEDDPGERVERDDSGVFQVIVLCAVCKRPFATIARN